MSVENARKKKVRFCGGETKKCGEKCAARRKEKQKKGLRLLFLCNREEFLFSPRQLS